MPTPAKEDQNNFRCSACGRYFHVAEELKAHEADCRLAKAATKEGNEELDRQDRSPHAKNDSDVRDFVHGTKT